MKALRYFKYGKTSRIEYTDVDKPTITDNELLVRVHSASINQADAYILMGKPFPLRFITGLFKPKKNTLGRDVSGVVEEVGSAVTEFTKGDVVFGEQPFSMDGSYAEYVKTLPKHLSKGPKNRSHNEISTLPIAGLTALQGLKLAEVKEGSKVLIYGASGGVGTFMIQVAKYFKAHVTAVCSTRNIVHAKESGADVIIDYKKESWNTNEQKYDAIIAANGYNKLKVYRDALKEDGIYVLSGGTFKQMIDVMILLPLLRKKGNKKFLSFTATSTKEDLDKLSELLETGAIKPIIDKVFPLKEGKKAFEHFISGKTMGKTVIQVKE